MGNRFLAGIGLCACLTAMTLADGQERRVKIGMDLQTPWIMKIEADGESAVVRSTRYATNFVFEGNRGEQWTELVHEIGVGYNDSISSPGVTASKQRYKGASVESVKDQLGIMTVPADVGDVLPDLLSDASVRYAYPVLFDLRQNTRIILTDRLIICAKTDAAGIAEIAARYNLQPVRRLRGTDYEWVLQLNQPAQDYPLDVVEQMKADPAIEWVQADTISELEKMAVLNDPLINNEWHLSSTGQVISGIAAATNCDMDVLEAWNQAAGASNVLIAVLDDGLESSHPEFAGKVDPRKWDFYWGTDNTEPQDVDDNHGTACAGVAAAAGGNGVGVAGVAYGANILPIKMFWAGFSATDSEIAESIRYAADYAPILSMSWGQLYNFTGPAIESACKYARQYGNGGQGSVLLAAAGNSADFYDVSISSLPAGVNTCRWVYVKDASIAKGDDACWLDSVTFPSGAGSENFDGVAVPGLPLDWTTSTTGAWTSVAKDNVHPADSGSIFLRSGPMGNNNRSYVQCVKNFASEGTLSYSMRVNCQDDISDGWQDYGAFEHPLYGDYFKISGTVAYPSKLDCVMTIGASDSSGSKSYYSQYGPEVDVVAPSSGRSGLLRIETADRQGEPGYNEGSGVNGDYCKAGDTSGFGGTSSATPAAAGLAALVRSMNTNLSPAQIRNIIRYTAKKIDTNSMAYTGTYGGGRNDAYGWGLASASGAVARALVTPDMNTLAANIRIMEMSLFSNDVSFVTVYNTSTSTSYSLSDMALTDNEAGGDITEGACRFPAGATLPPRGMAMVIFSTNATPAFLTSVSTNAASPNGPAGGLKVYEQTDSGLSYNGTAISNMLVLGSEKVAITINDNLMLYVTEGTDDVYLPDVIDGLTFGVPVAFSDNIFGAGPRTADAHPLQQVAGLQAGQTLKRISTNDSNNTAADFWIPGSSGLTIPASEAEVLIREGFNDGVASGWSSDVVRHFSGAEPSVSIEALGMNPSWVKPYEGNTFVRCNSVDQTKSSQVRFKRGQVFSTEGYSNIVAEFGMTHDPASPSMPDSVSVQWSTDGDLWHTAGTSFRYSSTTGWARERITFSPDASSQSLMMIALLFTGQGGNDCHVDDLTLSGTPIQWTLVLNSPHGTVSPYSGTNTYADNTFIEVSVVDPAPTLTTQLMAYGWQGTGSVVSGVGNSFSFSITENSQVDWLWNTQVWVNADVESNGVLEGSPDGWYAVGSEFSVSVTAESNHHFGGWAGQVPDGIEISNPLTFTVDSSRSILAQIRPDVAGSVSEPWLEHYYGPQSNYVALAETDTDGDGLRAWEEYWAGTDPTNPDSRFEIQSFSNLGDSNMLTWLGGTGFSGYVVQYTTNLTSGWNTVVDGVLRTPPTNVLVLPGTAGNPQTFYRVTVTNP